MKKRELLSSSLNTEELLASDEEEPIAAERKSFSCTEAGCRLDVFLSACLPSVSRSRIARLADEGEVTVDEHLAKPGQKLKAGQTVTIRVPEAEPLDAQPQDLPISILHEDEDMLVIDKPKGMVVHPAPGHPDGTLVNALLHHCGGRLSDINGVIRPGIVHRIDRDTSGLLVVAKNNEAHRRLSEELQHHGISRVYRAVVDGVLKEDERTLDAPIGRHPTDRKRMAINRRTGRAAVTHYRVIRRYRAHTLIECILETGRTHQIRVHMASRGHPVTGDPVYGTHCTLSDTQGQALHAWQLTLTHPTEGVRMRFTSPVPEWLARLLSLLEKREGGPASGWEAAFVDIGGDAVYNAICSDMNDRSDCMANEHVTFNVEGMSCEHCATTIRNALVRLNGVAEVLVDVGMHRVAVEYDKERIQIDILRDSIEDAGYKVR